MSTRVGTLQAPKVGGSMWLAAFLASVVILTIAMVAISFDRDLGRQGATTFVGRQVVNTPSELNAGGVGTAEQTFGDTAANTPSELSGGIGGGGELGPRQHVRQAAKEFPRPKPGGGPLG